MSKEQQIRTRMVARKLALQALYQWQMKKASIDEIKGQFYEYSDFKKADADYFSLLLNECTTKQHDKAVKTAIATIGYSLELVDLIEYAILRIALYEIHQVPEIDKPVAIKEAIRLAKKFGQSNSYRFVNKVLDQAKPTDQQ